MKYYIEIFVLGQKIQHSLTCKILIVVFVVVSSWHTTVFGVLMVFADVDVVFIARQVYTWPYSVQVFFS